MQKIAKFEKVSFDRFQKDWLKAFPETEDVQAVYDSIVLPQRATAGSAGYDFYVPAAVTFPKDASVLVPTGIRARMAEGWALSTGSGWIIPLALLTPIITAPPTRDTL